MDHTEHHKKVAFVPMGTLEQKHKKSTLYFVRNTTVYKKKKSTLYGSYRTSQKSHICTNGYT